MTTSLSKKIQLFLKMLRKSQFMSLSSSKRDAMKVTNLENIVMDSALFTTSKEANTVENGSKIRCKGEGSSITKAIK